MEFGLATSPPDWTEAERDWELAEAAGMRTFWLSDHLRDASGAGRSRLDGWALVAALAARRSPLRLGMLVSNLIYRSPMLVVKHAITVDQVSGGRFELGLGGGVFETDHAMAGVAPWPAAERFARLREATELVDRLLRGSCEPHDGVYYHSHDIELIPGAVQRPRPPITLGVNAARGIRLAARCADRWNTFAPAGVARSEQDQILEGRCRVFRAACADACRQPTEVVCSLLLFQEDEPWRSTGAFARHVERCLKLGFDELLLPPPASWSEQRTFERAALEVIAPQRAAPAPI